MLMAEYDYDMDIAVQREEAAEEGWKEGWEKGFTEGIYLTKEAHKLYKQGKDAAEIAKILKISIDQVQRIIS